MRVVALVGFAWIVGGCSDPCGELMRKVCDCTGPRAKAACAEAKSRREARDKEALSGDRCKKQLESFQCAQLE